MPREGTKLPRKALDPTDSKSLRYDSKNRHCLSRTQVLAHSTQPHRQPWSCYQARSSLERAAPPTLKRIWGLLLRDLTAVKKSGGGRRRGTEQGRDKGRALQGSETWAEFAQKITKCWFWSQNPNCSSNSPLIVRMSVASLFPSPGFSSHIYKTGTESPNTLPASRVAVEICTEVRYRSMRKDRSLSDGGPG